MHRTKRAARNAAWCEKGNPFAKRWAYKTQQDPQSLAENGDGTVLVHTQTDDPTDYTNHDPDSPVNDWKNDIPPRHANTLPPSATSTSNVKRRNQNEPIGDGPISSSPAPSIRRSTVHGEPVEDEKAIEMYKSPRFDSDKTEVAEDRQSNQQGKTHHGLRGWLQGRTTDRKQEMDDNNGKKKKEPKFTAMSQLKATLFNSWINVLLIACPVGIALHFAKANDIAIFVVNFIAIIPLAAMLSYATEEIALRTGEVIGGLLNASFGNAVELIVSIIALVKNQILIVQTSLIGSMLSNLLLVMGMCFFAGGVNRVEQAFNMTVAQTAASLLFLAVSSLLIPTVFNLWASTGTTDKTSAAPLADGEAALSRATAILLLIVYACYLFFQLKSHSKMYNAASEKNPTRDLSKQKLKMKRMVPGKLRRHPIEVVPDGDSQTSSDANAEDDREEPQLSIWVAILTLAISTVFVALNAEFLVDSINSITCDGGISKTFVGLILLPIVGNAAEHATALTVAIKDKMDLAIGVAVGSSMQIALLVLPLVVVLGWIIGKDDMTLYFDGFQIAVLFVAVLLVNYLIQDGKSHWLEGVLLMILYIIIAVAAWFYPASDALNDCAAS